MSITTDRIARKANVIEGRAAAAPDDGAKSYLFDALSSTLDSLTIGVVIVGDQGRILHANQAAQRMFTARSPIVSLGGCLCALQGELTKELRRAIATAQQNPAGVVGSGIGVPLVDKHLDAATAHVLPLVCNGHHSSVAAVFVTSPGAELPAEIGTVARIFSLTPAEARLLQHLVAGASLNEAAAALGIAEATARTHRNHIFTKTGVSRRTDLLVLVTRLVPPIRRPH
jgi:DNA-binding CsgD family transcriptional regulator